MRKSQSQGFVPSLFPFLSILTCTAGVLSFIIISIGVVSLLAPSIIVRLKSDAVQISKKPVYVECHPQELVIVRSGQKIDYQTIESEKSPLRKFLQNVQKNAASRYIVFAIYPGGERTFRKAYAMVKKINQNAPEGLVIDVGYEPFNKTWHLQPVGD